MLGKLKDSLKKRMSQKQKKQFRKMAQRMAFMLPSGNLNFLARLYETDKFGGHNYTPHYQAHLNPYRFKKIKLLEIGVGGYNDPNKGGESLRMWKKFFPYGKIFSLDIFDKSPQQEKRIRIFQGSQADPVFLNEVVNEMGQPDIIIDDGSHFNEHVIASFIILFPKLKDGGIYIVEDTQTSYWEDLGGDSKDLNNPNTMMNFFKKMADCLNHSEFIRPGYQPSYYDKNIVSIHFYHNMIFIHKGKNDEKSNMLVNNTRIVKEVAEPVGVPA
jgi:hypothetical protein